MILFFVAVLALAAALAWRQWADGVLDLRGAMGMTAIVSALLAVGFWLATGGF